jgi:hypothetical protein
MENHEPTDGEKAAWAAGRRLGLEEAADLAEFRYEHWNHTKGHGVSCDVTACEEIAAAIRALKE